MPLVHEFGIISNINDIQKTITHPYNKKGCVMVFF